MPTRSLRARNLITTCGTVVSINSFPMGNRLTTKGQQRERVLTQEAYRGLLNTNWHRDQVDLRCTAPRAWPSFRFLSEEEIQQLVDTHPSAPPLKAISAYDIKLVQRLLYYTASDLWLSEKDKDWHFLVLSTLREKTERTGGIEVLMLGRANGNRSETERKARG